MQQYLTYTDTDAFTDWPKMQPNIIFGYTKECNRCNGHGGWNLKLNAYPLHHYENNRENRHRYSHFRAVCDHCNGWGYTSPDESCIGHEWKLNKNLNSYQQQYQCLHCVKSMYVDTSD